MISFTLDAWTSPNCMAFLGITAHWITRNWELKEILIDFCKLTGSHSGENLAEVFVNCMNDLNILSKVYIIYFIFYSIIFIVLFFINLFFIVLNIDSSNYY
jgi:hypothetical protein